KEASVRRIIKSLSLADGEQRELGANASRQLSRRSAKQPDLEVVMRRIAGRHVLIDECRRVNVVDHEIELAVVIQIRVGRTIGKSRLVDSPAPAFVGEGHVAVVAEDIARFGVRWQVPQKS